MTKIKYPIEIPQKVAAAIKLAEELGFLVAPEGRIAGDKTYEGQGPSCCIPGVGRLLATLAAARPGGRIAEIGTGAGVGTAWLSHGMDRNATLVTYEKNPKFAAAVAELFADDPRVKVVCGDFNECFEGPVDLLFKDGGKNKPGFTTESMVCIGGQYVLDDLTPEYLIPDSWDKPDTKREAAFRNPSVIATEVGTSEKTCALIINRIA